MTSLNGIFCTHSWHIRSMVFENLRNFETQIKVNSYYYYYSIPVSSIQKTPKTSANISQYLYSRRPVRLVFVYWLVILYWRKPGSVYDKKRQKLTLMYWNNGHSLNHHIRQFVVQEKSLNFFYFPSELNSISLIGQFRCSIMAYFFTRLLYFDLPSELTKIRQDL